MKKVETIEFSIRKVGKLGWKEHFPEAHYDEDAVHQLSKFFRKTLEIHKSELKGSFQLVIKINRGYGKNKETGTTMIQNFKGTLGLEDMDKTLPILVKATEGKT